MQNVLAIALAAASVAAAATTTTTTTSADSMPDLSKIPQCALLCLTQAAGSSSCSITDPYCQCTAGSEDILKVLVSCLCQSDCSPEDLKSTLTASSDICKSALEAKGEEYKPRGLSPDFCKAGTAEPSSEESTTTPSTEPESSAASPPSVAPKTNTTSPQTVPSYGSNSTNSSIAKNTPTGKEPAVSTGGAAGVEARLRLVVTAALIGLAGAAMAGL